MSTGRISDDRAILMAVRRKKNQILPQQILGVAYSWADMFDVVADVYTGVCFARVRIGGRFWTNIRAIVHVLVDFDVSGRDGLV